MANSECGGMYADYVIPQRSSKSSGLHLYEDAEAFEKHLKDQQLKQAKEIIRNNHWPIDHPIRRKLWPLLCQLHGHEKYLPGYYEETLQEVLGNDDSPTCLPSFVDPSFCMNYCLNTLGKKNTKRVLCALSRTYPDVIYSPAIYPLTSLFIHYMAEDRVYHCISNLLTSKDKDFLSQTRFMHEEKAYVMQKLTKKFAKSAFNQLETELKENETIEKVFLKWQWWIFKSLPLPYLLRVIDCFLLDGYKALYRAALAILVTYTKQSGNAKNEFMGGGITERIVEFCLDIPITVDKFIKIAYSFRRLSRNIINQQHIKAQMTLQSRKFTRDRSVSLDGMPTSESANRLETSSLDIVIYDDKDTVNGMASSTMAPIGKFNSDMLTHEQIVCLWSWLPSRITILMPQLIYSSNEHGCCLTAFYMKVDTWEPTVLLIKTDTEEVFGAYCSTDWSSRNSQDAKGNRAKYFGTGESFLFTFSPNSIKFPWVGMASNEVGHSARLFMHASNEEICIGSGNGCGLWLDESLTRGMTEHCDTFDNVPLCSAPSFTCTLIEVFGFK